MPGRKNTNAQRILFVGIDKWHAGQIRRELEKAGISVHLSRSKSIENAKNILSKDIPDLLVVERDQEDGTGMDLLQGLKDQLNCPVVILSPENDEKEAINYIENGAEDYVLKGEGSTSIIHKIVLKNIVKNKRSSVKAKPGKNNNEERFRLLVNNQGEGIVQLDQDENIVICNPATAEIFGVSYKKLQGKNLSEFITKKEFEMVKEHSKSRQDGDKDSYELVIVRPDRERRDILVTVTSSDCDSEGKRCSYAIFRDITEMKRAEEALREQKNLETTQKLARSVAHEFRQPLFALQLIAELSQREEQKVEQIVDHTSQIPRLVERVNSLVNQLLSITKIETTPYVLGLEMLDLDESKKHSKN